MDKLPEGLSDFLDFDAQRKNVYDGVLQGLGEKYPLKNDRYTLSLSNVGYAGPETSSLVDQKKAILQSRSLYRPIKGTWNLVDNNTGATVDQKKGIIAHVPMLTQRGTYIIRGNEYSVGNQMRLRSGVYARRKDSGELESHFNVLSGGPGFRVMMDPHTGAFNMNVGQSQIKLYPLLKAAGASDGEIQQAWGQHYAANVSEDKTGATVAKIKAKLGRRRGKADTGPVVEQTVPEILADYPDLTETDVRAALAFAADRERRVHFSVNAHEVAV